MNKRYTIQVRETGESASYAPGPVIATIRRVLRAEQIGNFNPLFCTYRGNRRVLVRSLDGDLSDPFRREQGYAQSLYICPARV